MPEERTTARILYVKDNVDIFQKKGLSPVFVFVFSVITEG